MDVTVAGGGRGEGGPAAQGLGLAAHAAGPAADAAERDRTDDQRQLQGQLLAAGDVQVDLGGAGTEYLISNKLMSSLKSSHQLHSGYFV